MADIITTGIDISHHNGVIDWKRVKAATSPKISYVYIKASEGVSAKDSMALAHAQGAAGLDFGYYHFATPGNGGDPVSDATAEANWFAKVMATLPKATLMPVLDIEYLDPTVYKGYKTLTPAETVTFIQTFLNVMAKNGYKNVMIYGDANYLNTNLPSNHPFSKVPLWIANWTTKSIPTLPRGFYNWHNWQYTDSGKVDGITGVVDMNKTLNLKVLLKTAGTAGMIILGIGVAVGLFFLVKAQRNKKQFNGTRKSK